MVTDMPTRVSNLERLAYVLSIRSATSVELLREVLRDFERAGLQRCIELVNSPIQRHHGQTSVHLAAKNGLSDCLELLLEYGGNIDERTAP